MPNRYCDLFPVLPQRISERCTVVAVKATPTQHHDIKPDQPDLMQPKALSDDTLDPVAVDSTLEALFGDRQTQSRNR